MDFFDVLDSDFGPLSGRPEVGPPPPDMTVSPLPWRAGSDQEEPEIVAADGQGVVLPGDIGGISTEGNRQLILESVNNYLPLRDAFAELQREFNRIRAELYLVRGGK